MIAVAARSQKEGEVIHVIADRLEDEAPAPAVGDEHRGCLGRPSIGTFPHRAGPGDGARNGGARPRATSRRACSRPPRPTRPSGSGRAISTDRAWGNRKSDFDHCEHCRIS